MFPSGRIEFRTGKKSRRRKKKECAGHQLHPFATLINDRVDDSSPKFESKILENVTVGRRTLLGFLMFPVELTKCFPAHSIIIPLVLILQFPLKTR